MPPETDFLKRLETELASCQMPTVDPEEATIQEIVKDLHKMLTGNGGPTRGLITKVAGANVNIQDLKVRTDTIDQSLQDHRATCLTFRNAAAVKAAENESAAARTVVKFLWDNRTLVLVFVLAGILYLSSGWSNTADAKQMEQRLIKVLDTKLEKLIELRLAKLAGVKDASTDHSRTITR